jgi:2-polyprenyl-3-methyl-5-hydroxy-6-metoxy-1,4-benzoquinol methylase
MHTQVLDILICPSCRTDAPLALATECETDGDVEAGTLGCAACGASYPIVNGIPRFVKQESAGFDNFAFEWNRWKTIQIDRFSGHKLSETRFLADSRWSADWIKGKRILDAGCGAGRFADVAASLGAKVVACDLTGAVDACRDNTKDHGENIDVFQASIYDLPFRAESFDAVYCMGVIQHTSDPKKTMETLPAFLKPGGRLVYNFYERDFWPKLQVVKYALRLITPHLPIKATLKLSEGLVALFFPLARFLSRIRYVRIINHFLPICAVTTPELTAEQQRTMTLLDTFDWYSPRYEIRQKHEDVAALLESLGLADVDSAVGLAWAKKPESG